MISDEAIGKLVAEHFDLRPKGIVQMLDLLRPIYEKTAAYGHFGRDEPEFTWERTDRGSGPRPTPRASSARSPEPLGRNVNQDAGLAPASSLSSAESRVSNPARFG